ncbi:MAG: hypothetical protein OEV94_08185 [Deltaproteobacteria bacterium]|nr:hypothetical protein [Deltaproteobacteria bacterium]
MAHSILSWLKPLSRALVITLAMTLMLAPAAQAQRYKKHRNFYDIKELQKLFAVARESGLSQKDIEAMVIEDNGKVINAWKYLQDLLKAEKEKEARRQALLAKRYLSPTEIMDEMDQSQPEDLTQLRDSFSVNP